MHINTRRILGFALLYLVACSHASAQEPPLPTNQQDEVVTIHLAPGATPDKVLEILRTEDKFQTNKYVTEVFETKNTPAFELISIVRQAVGQEKGVVQGAKTEPVGDQPVRHFLTVTTTTEQMQGIREMIARLDTEGFVNSQGSSRRALRVQYRLASDLGKILAGTRATSMAKIFADDVTNTLYYDDSPYVAKAMEEYVQFFDVPTPQVEFDVQIIEIAEENSRKVGLDWDAWKRSLGGQFTLSANNFEGGDNFARLDTLLTLDATVLADFLNFTVQQGNGRLLQRSRMNASNLEPAIISDAKRYPVYDYNRQQRTAQVVTEVNPRVDAAGTRDDGEPPTNDPRIVAIAAPTYAVLQPLTPEQEGLKITIQPTIGMEAVAARIDISVNSLVSFDKLDRPVMAEQNLTNRFTLRNGEKLLLGTLERETRVNSRRGIPGLKDIPVIKYLFSVESNRSLKSRLFILATPTFSHIGYGAASLQEMKEKPALQFRESNPVMDDGVMEALLEEQQQEQKK